MAARLESLGYADLFHRSDDEAIDAVWSRPGARTELETLALEADAPPLARFLASEILFRRLEDYPPPSAKPALSKVYASALKEGFTVMANPWSLPGFLDGEAARHVLALGPGAIPEFEKLLDDNRSVLYWGSKEATFGNSYQYRVKDIAASLVAELRGKHFEPDPNPARRDAEIARLKAEL